MIPANGRGRPPSAACPLCGPAAGTGHGFRAHGDPLSGDTALGIRARELPAQRLQCPAADGGPRAPSHARRRFLARDRAPRPVMARLLASRTKGADSGSMAEYAQTPPARRPCRGRCRCGLGRGPGDLGSVAEPAAAPAAAAGRAHRGPRDRSGAGQVCDPERRHGDRHGPRNRHLVPGHRPQPGHGLPVPGGGDAGRQAFRDVFHHGGADLRAPLPTARWEGPWTVHIKVVRGGAVLKGPRPLRWAESWQANPDCPAGACAVRLSGRFNSGRFKATLTRAGAVYTGKTTASVFRCGPRSSSVPTRSTLKIRVTLTAAKGDSGAWAASSWAGTLAVSVPYTSSGTFYCNAFRLKASLSGKA